LLSPQAVAPVQAKLDELYAALQEGNRGRINLAAEELQFAAEKWLKPYPARAGAKMWKCSWSRSPWRWPSARSSCNRSRFPPVPCSPPCLE